ncbi:MAG: hypothetical protein MI892_27810 [Desulfobacterales bacterium]|nr:hypothetical protein [Desulfobacterales bacterium]
MECDLCKTKISRNEICEHLGKQLCEDCYMDVLSPTKTCDPWAAYNAKSFDGEPLNLNNAQKEILSVLKSQGGMTPTTLLEKLGGDWTFPLLEREFATLKRLEKIRAVKEDEQIILRIC